MAKRFGLKILSAHIDGTSLSVEGKYLSPEEEKIEHRPTEDTQQKGEEDSEPIPIKITNGYSRDNRRFSQAIHVKFVNYRRRRNSLIYASGLGQYRRRHSRP